MTANNPLKINACNFQLNREGIVSLREQIMRMGTKSDSALPHRKKGLSQAYSLWESPFCMNRIALAGAALAGCAPAEIAA